MNWVSFKKREILRGGRGAGVGFTMKDLKWDSKTAAFNSGLSIRRSDGITDSMDMSLSYSGSW